MNAIHRAKRARERSHKHRAERARERSQKRAAAVLTILPAAAAVLLAGCASNAGGHGSAAPAGPAKAANKPAAHQPAADQPAAVPPHADQPVGNQSTKSQPESTDPAPRRQTAPSRVASTPEFRNTTVYGLVRLFYVNDGVSYIVWDKADWQFGVPASTLNHLSSCQTNYDGDVMTNCNHLLRTTKIPTDTPVHLVQFVDESRIHTKADPHHPGRNIGSEPATVAQFGAMQEPRVAYAQAEKNVWLTFDGRGRLTSIDQQFMS
jgi:hypothetical protein